MNPERASNDERQDKEFAAAQAPESPFRLSAIVRRRPIRAVLLAAAVFAIPYSLARHRADGPASPQSQALPMGPVSMEPVSGNARTAWNPPVGMDRNNQALDRLTLDLTSPTPNSHPGSPAHDVKAKAKDKDATKDKDAGKDAKSAARHAAAEPAPVEPPKTHVATAAPEHEHIEHEHKATPAHAVSLEEVDRYLWNVYERSKTKKDASGDFTWKDEAAAARLGLVRKQYVIEGMDPDFRELLYDLGHAMDDAGIKWTILSGFRDDYRQGLASGYKAHVGNSFHGGSRATGGYGHGCAADIEASDGDSDDNSAVWKFVDHYGEKFGIFRPMKSNDPAHVQPNGDWHDVAYNLRAQNSYLPASLDSEGGKVTPLVDSPSGVSESQFDCVRSHHHPDYRMAGWHHHSYPSMHRYTVSGRSHHLAPSHHRFVVDAGMDKRAGNDREKFAKGEATAGNKREARTGDHAVKTATRKTAAGNTAAHVAKDEVTKTVAHQAKAAKNQVKNQAKGQTKSRVATGGWFNDDL